MTPAPIGGSIDKLVTSTFIFMMLVLKIPIAALLWIVYWAIKQEPEPEPAAGEGGGGPRRPHPREPRPRRPRRGAHGDPVAAPPPRVRSVTARARALDR
jgi:hypothetical protein